MKVRYAMARNRNRYISQVEINTENVKIVEKTYIAGVYIRLSQERKEDYRDKSYNEPIN